MVVSEIKVMIRDDICYDSEMQENLHRMKAHYNNGIHDPVGGLGDPCSHIAILFSVYCTYNYLKVR